MPGGFRQKKQNQLCDLMEMNTIVHRLLNLDIVTTTSTVRDKKTLFDKTNLSTPLPQYRLVLNSVELVL